MPKRKPSSDRTPKATRVHTALPINADSVGALYFTLPQEQESFETACNAGKYRGVLYDLDQEMRSVIKYEHIPFGCGPSIKDTTEYWRTRLWQLMNDQGIQL